MVHASRQRYHAGLVADVELQTKRLCLAGVDIAWSAVGVWRAADNYLVPGHSGSAMDVQIFQQTGC